MLDKCGRRFLVLALGGNVAGRWGAPAITLARAVTRVQQEIGEVFAVSPQFVTEALSGNRQPSYRNLVVAVSSERSAGEIMRVIRRLEREAGRRTATSRRWANRPLDIDIIDFGGRVHGWRGARDPCKAGPAISALTTPHPRIAARAFVLIPLLAIVPHWWHPVLGCPGRRLLARIAPRLRGSVLAIEKPSCDDVSEKSNADRNL